LNRRGGGDGRVGEGDLGPKDVDSSAALFVWDV
jgi:hypothetical protein